MSYIKEIRNILSLIWLKNIRVRILMLSSLIIVYLATIGQSFVPLIFKHIVDSLSRSMQVATNSSLFGWLLISYGVGWTLCQLLPAFRIRLTFRVIEYILIDIISHTINKIIDLDFLSNTKKRTGELIAIMDRAQQGLPTLLDGVFVQIIPTILLLLLLILVWCIAHY
jgi:ABC-type multidrug transport system fused ATPase/permease subunit